MLIYLQHPSAFPFAPSSVLHADTGHCLEQVTHSHTRTRVVTRAFGCRAKNDCTSRSSGNVICRGFGTRFRVVCKYSALTAGHPNERQRLAGCTRLQAIGQRMPCAHLIHPSSQRGFGKGPRPASLYICVVASSVLLNLPIVVRSALKWSRSEVEPTVALRAAGACACQHSSRCKGCCACLH